MRNPRWRKVLSDLWGNKTRTILIVLSIAVGVFAVGTIVSSQMILSRELEQGYAAINPSSGMVRINESFDDDLVEVIRHMPGVRDAEGKRSLNVRIEIGPGEWRDLRLFASADYQNIRINKIYPEQGAWPPPERELLIERAALELTHAQVGDIVHIKTADGTDRSIRIAGLVHDFSQLPAFIDGTPYGYIAFDTLEWLGEPREYNELHIIVAENPTDKAHVRAIVNMVKDKVEQSGRTIALSVSAETGQLPLNDILQALLFLLGVLGFLSLLLSAFLVINTITALMAQQVRQIGVMKAIGARPKQIMSMYLALVLGYGLIALALGIPLGILGGQLFSNFMASKFNFDLTSFNVPPIAIGLQIVVGLLVPIGASLYPISAGIRITAAQAMSSYGPGVNVSHRWRGASQLAQLFDSLLALLRSQALLLSLRNTVRRKGRLTLTLITLTLGGAIFIGVLNVRAAMLETIDDLLNFYQFDVWVSFTQPYRIDRIAQESLRVPGTAQAGSWIQTIARRVRAKENESDNFMFFAPLIAEKMLKPSLISGRWLLPEDDNALVINTDLLKDEPDITLGSEIVLKIEGRESSWRVVGVVLGSSFPVVFANYPYATRVTHDPGRGNSALIRTTAHDIESQRKVAAMLETLFKRSGMRIDSITTMSEERAEAQAAFNIIVILLLVMASLLAVVGGLGLMGTMSINVIERTREIGVMRAIGASDGAVMRVFIVEGVLIGVLSWFLGTVAAIPLSNLMSDSVGLAVLKSPLNHVFSVGGALLWLLIVIVLAALASFLPARSASRLTVRDVLAYE